MNTSSIWRYDEGLSDVGDSSEYGGNVEEAAHLTYLLQTYAPSLRYGRGKGDRGRNNEGVPWWSW